MLTEPVITRIYILNLTSCSVFVPHMSWPMFVSGSDSNTFESVSTVKNYLQFQLHQISWWEAVNSLSKISMLGRWYLASLSENLLLYDLTWSKHSNIGFKILNDSATLDLIRWPTGVSIWGHSRQLPAVERMNHALQNGYSQSAEWINL